MTAVGGTAILFGVLARDLVDAVESGSPGIDVDVLLWFSSPSPSDDDVRGVASRHLNIEHAARSRQ